MTLFRVAAMLWAAVAMGGAATGPGRSDMAAAILTDTGLARQAIARHDRQAALDHVGDAIAQAGKILATVPKPSPPGPVLVPVYRGPVKRGGLDVGSAPTGSKPRGRCLERGDWVAADTSLSAIPGSLIERRNRNLGR